ncbi:MAG: S41 family peptidase, partial [Firmicutes bacterium]|nr:S41 family peptidase [Bacillota bacterium]
MRKWKELPQEAKTILYCILCAVLAGAMTAAVIVSSFGGLSGFQRAKKFAEINSVIQTYYVGEADVQAVDNAAFTAQIRALGDRWSFYMSAADYQNYVNYSNNQATGIGITVVANTGTGEISVFSVAAGTPAAMAGVVAGDVILSVAGEDMTGKSVGELSAAVAAQGTADFTLGLRGSDGAQREVTVHRETFSVESVSYKMLDENSKIGYVKLINFEAGSGQSAIDAVNDLIGQGAKGLIFDVRSNPGGQVSELTKFLDFLLPEGDIFVSVGRDGKEEVTTSDAASVDLPMAVLINKDSYSAAEFFAAALHEYGKAFTVGEATTGKSRSQITVVLGDGSAVHISSRTYLTPRRVDLAAQGGLKPDYPVEMAAQGDAQLDAAR